jgi:hypothetical protein
LVRPRVRYRAIPANRKQTAGFNDAVIGKSINFLSRMTAPPFAASLPAEQKFVIRSEPARARALLDHLQKLGDKDRPSQQRSEAEADHDGLHNQVGPSNHRESSSRSL